MPTLIRNVAWFLEGLKARNANGGNSKNAAGAPGDNLKDEELLRRFLTMQDTDAFQCILARHGDAVYRRCRLFHWNEKDAEDAFQAVFIVLLKHKRHDIDNLRSWLLGVATTLAYKEAPKEKKRRELLPIDSVEVKETLADYSSNTEPERREKKKLVQIALARVPEKYREIIILKKLHNLSFREIAELQNQPQGTVASRYRKGERLLCDELKKLGLPTTVLAITALFAGEVAATSLRRKLLSKTVDAAVEYSICNTIKSVAVSSLVDEATRELASSSVRTIAVSAMAYMLAGALGVILSLAFPNVGFCSDDKTPGREFSVEQAAPSAPISIPDFLAKYLRNNDQAVIADVVGVIDGSTIEVEIDHVRTIVRLLGVDSPPIHDNTRPELEPLGQRARAFTQRLVENKTVVLTFNSDPRVSPRPFPVLMNRVYDLRGVNLDILSNGYGVFDGRIPFNLGESASNSRDPNNLSNVFREAAKQARIDGCGNWADDRPQLSSTRQ